MIIERCMGAAVTAALVLTLAGCGDTDEGVAPQAGTTSDPATSDGDAGGADPAALDSVKADVENVAVSLESFYRGTPYPETAAEAIETLTDAGLTLAPGNTIGGYVYDPDTVEFTLCVEDEAGAWATYDTAPMTLRENGVDGGCPFG